MPNTILSLAPCLPLATLYFLTAACAPPAQEPAAIQEPAVNDAPPVVAVSAARLDVLDYRLGTWDLVITLYRPDLPSTHIVATSTHERILGGDYLVDHTEWGRSEKRFHGVGNTAYDLTRQKYVHTWSDGSSAMTSLEGDYDESTRTITYAGEKIDFGQQDVVTTRWVEHPIDADHWVARAYAVGPDGKEVLATECAYSRARPAP